MTDSTTISRTGGRLRSAARRPGMRQMAPPGSIHDDATAQGLGFRGGTIAG